MSLTGLRRRAICESCMIIWVMIGFIQLQRHWSRRVSEFLENVGGQSPILLQAGECCGVKSISDFDGL
jgi:hypothetical protein